MRALVTGGAGFIGSHLVERLLKDGWNVDIIDNLHTGKLSNLPVSTLPVYQISIVDLHESYGGTLSGLCERADVIFHLAARVGVLNVLRNSRLTIQRNVESTSIMLQYAAAARRPILITSSSEVYGRRTDSRPLTEDMDLYIGPELRWAYAAGKLSDEFLARAYHEEDGLHVVIARLFNTIGPRQDGLHGNVVPRMIDAALSGKPIEVYGGHQSRSFCWISDTIDALLKLIQEPRAYGEVVNVGNHEEVRILDLALMIKHVVFEFTGKEAAITNIPWNDVHKDWQDIMTRRPSLEKLHNLVGYAPTLNLYEMIRELVRIKIGEKLHV